MTDLRRRFTDSLPPILDVKDLRSALRLSNNGIYLLLRDPRLHAYRTDEGLQVNRSDLISYLNRETVS